MNSYVTPLLSDQYQYTMAYSYFKSGIHESEAVFEMFFRKNPFEGEFTIFGGLSECLDFVKNYKLSEEELQYLKESFAFCEKFIDYLRQIDCSQVTITAAPEGSIVFPRCPVMILRGPLLISQLLETTLLNLCNFSSLITTYAAHMKLIEPKSKLIEFGLRRAQGPDGAMTASKYSYIGGFDGTSNLQAGKKFGIKTIGTHAHSFVEAFSSLAQVSHVTVNKRNLVELVQKYRKENKWTNTIESELAAFIAYAATYPNAFLALIDTYDTLSSGVYNYLSVALALYELGYKPIGVRIDSGDLAYLSKELRKIFTKVGNKYQPDDNLVKNTVIVASNDICANILRSLLHQTHEINVFGIGTHLVTCKAQPALGMVFKLVSLNKEPKIKLSDQCEKITLPGEKKVYRLFLLNKETGEESPAIDLLCTHTENPPLVGEKILCRHPSYQTDRVYIIPCKVEQLHTCVWDGSSASEVSITDSRMRCRTSLESMRKDHLRSVNPTPYKVSLSSSMYDLYHALIEKNKPILVLV